MSPTFNAPLVLLMQNFFITVFIVLLGLCVNFYKSQSKYFLALLPVLALAVHQVEEYVLSPLLFGDYYHFLNWASRNGMDISPIEVVPNQDSPWFNTAHMLVGPWEMGKDFSDYSCKDYNFDYDVITSETYHCEEGYGTLLNEIYKDANLELEVLTGETSDIVDTHGREAVETR